MRRVKTNSTQQALEIRRRFTTYFTTVGVVSWQEESITRGKFQVFTIECLSTRILLQRRSFSSIFS